MRSGAITEDSNSKLARWNDAIIASKSSLPVHLRSIGTIININIHHRERDADKLVTSDIIIINTNLNIIINITGTSNDKPGKARQQPRHHLQNEGLHQSKRIIKSEATLGESINIKPTIFINVEPIESERVKHANHDSDINHRKKRQKKQPSTPYITHCRTPPQAVQMCKEKDRDNRVEPVRRCKYQALKWDFNKPST